MATIRKLRGRWQAQVRRRGMKPRCKSFDTKIEAEKWWSCPIKTGQDQISV